MADLGFAPDGDLHALAHQRIASGALPVNTSGGGGRGGGPAWRGPGSYTHLRAHETVLDLVCRLLLEKKNITKTHSMIILACSTHNTVSPVVCP